MYSDHHSKKRTSAGNRQRDSGNREARTSGIRGRTSDSREGDNAANSNTTDHIDTEEDRPL